MDIKSERDLVLLAFGTAAGASGMMAYVSLLAAFTDIYTYNPWMSYGFDSPLIAAGIGLSFFSLTALCIWLLPAEDVSDTSSTRVDA